MNMNFRLLLAFLMVSLSSLQAADGCKKRLEDLSIEELESTLQSEANSLSTPEHIANFQTAMAQNISEPDAKEAAAHLTNEKFKVYLDLMRATFKHDIAMEVAQLLTPEQLKKYLEEKNSKRLTHDEALQLALNDIPFATPVEPAAVESKPKIIRPTLKEMQEVRKLLNYNYQVDYLRLRYKFKINHADAMQVSNKVETNKSILYGELRQMGHSHESSLKAAKKLMPPILKEYVNLFKIKMGLGIPPINTVHALEVCSGILPKFIPLYGEIRSLGIPHPIALKIAGNLSYNKVVAYIKLMKLGMGHEQAYYRATR